MDAMTEALSALCGRPVERGSLTRPGQRRLRWVEAGEGPPVVLVAGAGETCLTWATVLPELAAGHRVIAYDRAGTGMSDPAPALDLDGQVADLAALLAQVGPSVVVGHSWGGLLARLAAAREPVAGLVLLDPFDVKVLAGVPWPLRLAERAMGSLLVAAFRLGLFGRLAAGEARRLAEAATADPEVRDALVHAYLGCYTTRGQVAMIRDEARIPAGDPPPPSPPVPTRILSAVRGSRDAAAARIRADGCTDRCVHSAVTDAGHYIHHDRPEPVLAAVRELS
ncbi:alpha/beta fold hydrolase [Phytomonospora endophytica]|uniref:Pimeloyl-ACP methyl ester carboxylesterase n=1 Tax=Phytomonospora endophytica TaxID=714109 RepID=A0A841FTR2_9ACTN|nr:alpha/beta hydrolase [Phytomonospora endophytica]MBB6039725.1 pimeloyl-ACP methyl ester carboxylesterase [Phytomonospora endophytica]GIG70939.1 hypothetical protein Pen01_72340 [Phytomonospora endophytica]